MIVEVSRLVPLHGSSNTKVKVCVAVVPAQASLKPSWNPSITIVYEPGGYVVISLVENVHCPVLESSVPAAHKSRAVGDVVQTYSISVQAVLPDVKLA